MRWADVGVAFLHAKELERVIVNPPAEWKRRYPGFVWKIEEVSLWTTSWSKTLVSDISRNLGYSWRGSFIGAAIFISPFDFWSGDASSCG